jgi:uroporphyrinogen III methyltransferase/synthase
MTDRLGFVSLVGAGPGDVRLITLAGLSAIERAEVVVYDMLVNPQLLEHAPDADRIFVGKQGGGKYTPQEQINAILIDQARQGKRVVRLKGGDPLVFARGAEELEALSAAGIDFEIIPGVTAALAAAATAAIPLTHRHESSTLVLVTGHEDSEKEAGVDWSQLARVPGTLAIYMARAKIGPISAALIAGGKDPNTPIAFVQWAGSNQQVTHVARLADALSGAPPHVGTPMLAIIGKVVAHRHELAWFESRPLFGQTILLLRPEEQNQTLASRLEDAGATVLSEPTLRIAPPDDWEPLDQAIADLERFNVLVFTSRHGVTSFLDRLWRLGKDARALAHLQIAVVGPGPAEELARSRIHADIVPDEFRAERLAELLLPDAPWQRFLLVRADRGRKVLEETLAPAAREIVSVVGYRQIDIPRPSARTIQHLRAGKIDWVFLTSGNVARGFFSWLDSDLPQILRERTKLLSISPITSQVVREAGYPVALEASKHSPEGMMDELLASMAVGSKIRR